MRFIIIFISVLLICFYAIALLYPSRWIEWDKWHEHIKTHRKDK